MKISNFYSKTVIVLSVITAITISSCSKTEDEIPLNISLTGNTGPLNLMALDTAKVIKMSENGAFPTVVLNRKLNTSSYIYDFAFSPDGTKFIYVETQQSGTFPNQVRSHKLKIANINGSNDIDVFSAQNALQGSNISSVRYCSDGKIFFAYSLATASGNAFALSYNTINSDGTGLVAATTASFGAYFNVSNDRKYIVTTLAIAGTNNLQTYIYDRAGDGGAGSVYYTESYPSGVELDNASFTNDGKFVVIPFREANAIKIKIITMATKTAVVKTLVTGLTSLYLDFSLKMASDSNRGVLTVGGFDVLKSKSYVFNAATGIVSAPFENNDKYVIDVYAY